MIKLLHFGALLFVFLLAGCKKDEYHSPPKPVIPPNDIIETEPHDLRGITVNISDAVGGYYVGLPAHYGQTTKTYPTIIFLHGAGQYGNGAVDLSSLLNDGIPQLLDAKRFPPNVISQGKNFSFVVLTPQFRWQPADSEVVSFIQYAKQNYRLDPSRIYISGFSLGGLLTADFASFHAAELAAVVPIAGASNYNVKEKCMHIAQANLPVWCLHNTDDQQISPEDSKAFIDTINSFHPVIPAKLTLLPDFGILNHDAWTKATDPDFKENGMNIYQWMLQYTR